MGWSAFRIGGDGVPHSLVNFTPIILRIIYGGGQVTPWRVEAYRRVASGHFSFNSPCFCLFLVRGELLTIDSS